MIDAQGEKTAIFAGSWRGEFGRFLGDFWAVF
jgi:hypothetical protein